QAESCNPARSGRRLRIKQLPHREIVEGAERADAALHPALLNQMSMPSRSPAARLASTATWLSSVTSVAMNVALPPEGRLASAAASPRVASLQAITTVAPSAASLRAAARPIPVAPPVTTATRLSRLPMVALPSFVLHAVCVLSAGPDATAGRSEQIRCAH